ncbi:DNA polymerase III subunit psi [bacterium 19MO03SA05]|uniref:DNA polymerase III subunit psi n=1 Tax=bacterium 19MO03SA05 TaxID=2920620 RepID=A0AAU6VHU7_UNCXX|nr:MULTISPECIES: DNA polymerase III subunit psi [unclassified Vibrio]EKO3659099.1 DNA polymerase III subunit psi [Vibrio metschnikovii]EKO3792597.1 DNA polymerase III subunit psi [Vibrio metschnikovii]EKO3895223.1 DNA polymerase III subunit psi [Vibrio metschnikovii]EKO3919663.1 DNA polymerase III subunit psi [Vibrio metschnikovii]MDQ2109304.1 DNA polymerase III subunit psi [Vibrio sp. 2017_1457_15]
MFEPQHYLQAMGIQEWQLIHPQRLAGYSPPIESLDKQCRLLLVSSLLPSGSQLVWLERVLNSFNLNLSQARHVYPQQLCQLELNDLQWIWYVDCQASAVTTANALHTPALSEVEGNTHYRRDLWQQICAYGAQ